MPHEEISNVLNVDAVTEQAVDAPDGWISFYKVLTPAPPRVGHLGMNLTGVPPGQSGCPFHTH